MVLNEPAKDDLTELDVCLNGARDYVQGTQLIARATELIAAKSDTPLTVSAAAFQHITDRTVFLSRAAPDPDAATVGTVLGTLGLRGADGQESWSFIEGPDHAPRRDVPPDCAYALVPGSQSDVLSGRFEVSGLSGTESYLVALIQSVKKLHEGVSDSVTDIWFTGLRGADIPVGKPFPCSAGMLAVSYRRLMRRDEVWQSLLAVQLTDPDGAMVTKSAISFAFKSETRPDVD